MPFAWLLCLLVVLVAFDFPARHNTDLDQLTSSGYCYTSPVDSRSGSQWQKLQCNVGPRFIDRHVSNRAAADRLRKSADSLPVVAIIIAVTNRKLINASFDTIPLFSRVLPQLEASLEAGFEYWLYLAHERLDTWFHAHHYSGAILQRVTATLLHPAEARSIRVRATVLEFANWTKQPGPTLNFAMKAAYEDGESFCSLGLVSEETKTHAAASTLSCIFFQHASTHAHRRIERTDVRKNP
jgi:hypothetical protein